MPEGAILNAAIYATVESTTVSTDSQSGQDFCAPDDPNKEVQLYSSGTWRISQIILQPTAHKIHACESGENIQSEKNTI